MKVVAVIGSPRENGASVKVVNQMITGAKEAGHEVVVYDVNKMNIHGCMACGYCRANNADCIQNDDMKQYFDDLHSCGALIVSAPNYYAQVAGPMITFMNRHYCMTTADKKTRLTPGIKLVGVFSQGAPEKFGKYDETYKWYLSTFLAKEMKLEGMFVIGGDSDLSPEGKIMTDAYETGKNL